MDKLTQAREALHLTEYEIQVLLGTSIHGCTMSPDRVFSLDMAWHRLRAIGLIDRADGLAIATEKGREVVARILAALSDGEAVEPVAWRFQMKEWGENYWHYFRTEPKSREDDEIWQPLFASPPDQSDAALRERVAELEAENTRLAKERDGWKNVAELERDRAVKAEARATEGARTMSVDLPSEAELKRYINRCREMSEDGKYSWWSRLADILTAFDRDRQLSQASHGAVRELEWERGAVDWARPLPGMKYVACSTTPEGSWGWWLDGAPDTRGVFPTEAEAKAAAQSDFARRILASLEPAAPGREEATPLGESHDAELSICRALDCLRNDLTQEAFEQLNDALIAVRSSPPTGKDAVQAVTWNTMDSAPRDGRTFFAVNLQYDTVRAYRWEGAPNYWNSIGGSDCIRPEYQDRYLWIAPPTALQQKETGR